MFMHVIVPELNTGQLKHVLAANYQLKARGISKVRGLPFTVSEIVRGVRAILGANTRHEPLDVAIETTKPRAGAARAAAHVNEIVISADA